MSGSGYPMLATHDPRLIDIATALALLTGRSADRFEYQMLYGIRPTEQQRLAEHGVAGPGVRAVRQRLVRLPGPPAGRAAR